MEPPVFSVVIPVYNRADYLQRAVRSVQTQPASAINEIIIVDDGSSDGSAIVAEEMAADDSRIVVIRQSNAGVAAARNRGARAATHPFVLFLDSDDEWLGSFVPTIQSLIERFPQCGVFATAYTLRQADGVEDTPAFFHVPHQDSGGVIERFFKSIGAGPSPVWTSAVCVRRTAFDQVGGFPAGVTHGEDRVLWANLALEYDIAWSPRVGAIYHQGSGLQSAHTWCPQHGAAYLRTLERIHRKCCESERGEGGQRAEDVESALIAQHRTRLNNCAAGGFYGTALLELAWLAVNDEPSRLPVHLVRLALPRFALPLVRRLVRRFPER